ncbi:hypothetical protein AYO44_08070 [Planctomycetaceae bacterium SCGC AG-212-F19]|nr:hypothetical protein AYO44_08070 [Planctomycetaceae bacterium SCGC AG-212-F19]
MKRSQKWLSRLSRNVAKWLGNSPASGSVANRRRQQSFRPGLEHLEARELMSTTPITDMTQWAQATVTPTTAHVYLNFDGNGANIQAFQAQPGQTRDAAIQDIVYRVSEIFSPFNVSVQRITGANNYHTTGGDTTVFIGGDTNDININSTGLATKFTYSRTPWGFIDYASQFRGFDHAVNSDAYDLSYIDPMQNSTPLSQAAAANPANWTNVQSDALIAQNIAHEVGHTLGLAHVLTAPTPDTMSYNATNAYFANQTFNITDANNTGTQTVTDTYHARPYSEYQVGFYTVPLQIQTQNSFTYLEAVTGDRTADGNAHWSDPNTVDPSTHNNSAARVIGAGSNFNDWVGWDTGYNVYKLTVGATQQVHINVQPQTQLNPNIMIRDASGNLLFFNASSGVWSNAHIDFQATAGQTYYVVVGSENGSYSGMFTMNVTANPPVPNIVGASFTFTMASNPSVVVGKLQVRSEDVNTGSFTGVYTDYFGLTKSVAGSISGTQTTGGLTTSNIWFQGSAYGYYTTQFSGTLSGTGNAWPGGLRDTISNGMDWEY